MNIRHLKTRESVFCVRDEKLDGFLTDSFYFRDAKAYSRSPGLLFEGHTGNEPKIFVMDRFTLHHEYIITRESGRQFVEITRDDNIIHRDHDVISGAMTVSKIIVPVEILFPNMEILDVHVKFMDFSHYSRRIHNVFVWRSVSPEHIHIEVTTYQEQRTIARTDIFGHTIDNLSNVVEVKKKEVNWNHIEIVQEYFKSLGIASEAYFEKEGYIDYTYPLGFIASLPSAEIVHKWGGQGGMINVLRIDFGSHKRIPITGKADIEVRLERSRIRGTFNKILTRIANGLETYYHGIAIVNPVAKLS